MCETIHLSFDYLVSEKVVFDDLHSSILVQLMSSGMWSGVLELGAI